MMRNIKIDHIVHLLDLKTGFWAEMVQNLLFYCYSARFEMLCKLAPKLKILKVKFYGSPMW